MRLPRLRPALFAPATLAAGAAFAGCFTVATVRIPNPITRGLVENRVYAPDTDLAAHFGLPPATFTQEARLASLDAQRACFQLTLRINGDQGHLAVPSEWRVYLRGEPGLENNEPVFGPAVAPAVSPMQGTVPRTSVQGLRTECRRVGGSTQCSSTPNYVTVRVPAVVNLLTGGGAVCFVHNGSVRANARQLTLHLDDPDNALHRYAFRWEFTQ